MATVEERVLESQSEERTFIRVKRKITDEPASQLRLSYKRQKKDVYEEDKGQLGYDTVNDVLEFAGTVHPHECVRTFVSDFVGKAKEIKSVKEEGAVKALQVAKTRRQQILLDARRKSARGRYKVVSAKRGLEEEAKEAETKDEGEKSNFLFQMYELVEPDEQQQAEGKKPKVQEEEIITVNGEPMIRSVKDYKERAKGKEEHHDYVYDVYTVKSLLPHVEDLHVDVEHLWELELLPEAPNEDEEEGPKDEADTDSNSENNPNNDYPDEESKENEEVDEEEYYESFEQPEYEPHPDYPFFEDEEHMKSSKAMKALAKHLKEIELETSGGNLKGLEQFSSSEEADDDDDSNEEDVNDL